MSLANGFPYDLPRLISLGITWPCLRLRSSWEPGISPWPRGDEVLGPRRASLAWQMAPCRTIWADPAAMAYHRQRNCGSYLAGHHVLAVECHRLGLHSCLASSHGDSGVGCRLCGLESRRSADRLASLLCRHQRVRPARGQRTGRAQGQGGRRPPLAAPDGVSPACGRTRLQRRASTCAAPQAAPAARLVVRHGHAGRSPCHRTCPAGTHRGPRPWPCVNHQLVSPPSARHRILAAGRTASWPGRPGRRLPPRRPGPWARSQWESLGHAESLRWCRPVRERHHHCAGRPRELGVASKKPGTDTWQLSAERLKHAAAALPSPPRGTLEVASDATPRSAAKTPAHRPSGDTPHPRPAGPDEPTAATGSTRELAALRHSVARQLRHKRTTEAEAGNLLQLMFLPFEFLGEQAKRHEYQLPESCVDS